MSELMQGVSLRLERQDDNSRRVAMRMAWALSFLLNESHARANKLKKTTDNDAEEGLPGVLDFKEEEVSLFHARAHTVNITGRLHL